MQTSRLSNAAGARLNVLLPQLTISSSSIALYVHWPFCVSKCPYCDFNSHVAEKPWEEPVWAGAYLQELEYARPYLAGKTLTSIFFGGGTPSLMQPLIVEKIIHKISQITSFHPSIEITLEANPHSTEMEKMHAFRAAGINRVSLGVQALNAKDLTFLGRAHSISEALDAIAHIRTIFPRYSFDLIYARPEQTLSQWEKELSQALTLADGHLSLYQLTIEKGTPFFMQYKQGSFSLPSSHLSTDMYLLTDRLMMDAGLPAYEISNYAKPGQACRHNMTYWEYGEYMGIGPGAHSRVTHQQQYHALMTHHHPSTWLQSIKEKGHAFQTHTPLSTAETISEALLMGLRLTQGVKKEKLQQVSQRPWQETIYYPAFTRCLEEKLIKETPSHFYLTLEGRLVTNAVVKALVQE